MPEGDTIFSSATTLRKALLDKTIVKFESSVAPVLTINTRTPVVGRRVCAVEARGKNLVMVLRLPDDERDETSSEAIKVPESLDLSLIRSDLVLYTHMRMTGSWHIYRPGERWQKPDHYAKAVLYTEDFVAPCFSAPIVELLTARDTARHPKLTKLGPDAITEAFDPAEARARMRQRPDLPIGVAMMVQQAMAGVGNIFKSEVMFLQRVSPFIPVRDLSDDVLDGLISESHNLLMINKGGGERRTMFHLNPRERLWAYGRGGEPCRKCGTKIKMQRQGLDGRSTYYCPHCQGVE